MSIKIDLLPAYVNLRRWFKRLLSGSVLLLACVAMVLYVLYYKDKLQLDVVTQNLQGVQKNKQDSQSAESKTTSIKSDSAPVATQVKFYSDALRTGAERAALIDLASRYIYSHAYVDDITFGPGTMTVEAHVKTVEDYENMLLKMRNGSSTYGGVLFTGDPDAVVTTEGAPTGYEKGKPHAEFTSVQTETPEVLNYPFKVKFTAKLKNTDVMPVEPGSAAPAAAGGTPGAPVTPGGPGAAGGPAATPPTPPPAATPAAP